MGTSVHCKIDGSYCTGTVQFSSSQREGVSIYIRAGEATANSQRAVVLAQTTEYSMLVLLLSLVLAGITTASYASLGLSLARWPTAIETVTASALAFTIFLALLLRSTMRFAKSGRPFCIVADGKPTGRVEQEKRPMSDGVFHVRYALAPGQLT